MLRVVGARALQACRAQPSRIASAMPAVGVAPLRTLHLDATDEPLSAIFGINCFNKAKEEKYLSKTAFASLEASRVNKTAVSEELAADYARAIKEWAETRGVTHYTHWFQPNRQGAGVKHMVMLDSANGVAHSEFSKSHLLRGEPDGSSFPSGGLRQTHSARSYTAWDPNGHPFILDHGNGATVYIPSIFFTYNGEAEDARLPLLRSATALQTHALALFQAMGETSHTSVHSECGPEQEFFLIDHDHYKSRPDLVVCGRTVFGAPPPKGQERDDHYFGEMSERVLCAIHDMEVECMKLGIGMECRHCEVAPAQYEVSSKFDSVNVATDQNAVLMTVMDRVAVRHGFKMLYHEKPFAYVNGSGKHNNWSLGTNCLPTVWKPHDIASNVTFNVFTAVMIQAVSLHGDLLRISVSSAGNDHRLGACEAPPAIMSVFLGSEVERGLLSFIGETVEAPQKAEMKLGADNLPPIVRDETDRNRTSPVAYTGYKFEIRAVGSSHTMYPSNIAFNTIMADSARRTAAAITAKKEAGMSQEAAIKAACRDIWEAHGKVCYEGDGYSQEWVEEAERRGLPNLHTTVDALEELTSSKNIDLYESTGVLSPRELHALQEVLYEQFTNIVASEGLVGSRMAKQLILPAAVEYANSLAGHGSLESDMKARIQLAVARLGDLDAALGDLEGAKDPVAAAAHASEFVRPALDSLRLVVDDIEVNTPTALWPMPTYADMILDEIQQQ